MRSGTFMRWTAFSKLIGFAALLSFGYQASALPIHVSAHAAQISFHQHAPEVAHAENSGRVVESDCDLCSLATHQAIALADFSAVVGVGNVVKAAVSFPVTSSAARRTLTPPVRGPPARA